MSTKRRDGQRVLGYQCGQHMSHGGYMFLELYVYEGSWSNLHKRWIEANGQDEDYHIARMKLCRELTGDTWVFYSRDRHKLEIKWQANRTEERDRELNPNCGEWSRWYAPKLETDFNRHTAAFAQRLHKAHDKAERGHDESPEAWITTLCELGAVPIKYADVGLDRWIEDAEWTLDKLVPTPPNQRVVA